MRPSCARPAQSPPGTRSSARGPRRFGPTANHRASDTESSPPQAPPPATPSGSRTVFESPAASIASRHSARLSAKFQGHPRLFPVRRPPAIELRRPPSAGKSGPSGNENSPRENRSCFPFRARIRVAIQVRNASRPTDSNFSDRHRAENSKAESYRSRRALHSSDSQSANAVRKYDPRDRYNQFGQRPGAAVRSSLSRNACNTS